MPKRSTYSSDKLLFLRLSPPERRIHTSQIIILTNCVVVSSVGMKRVDCLLFVCVCVCVFSALCNHCVIIWAVLLRSSCYKSVLLGDSEISTKSPTYRWYHGSSVWYDSVKIFIQTQNQSVIMLETKLSIISFIQGILITNQEQNSSFNENKTSQVWNKPDQSVPYKMACAPRDDLDQPAYPHSRVRVVVVRLKTLWLIATHWMPYKDSDQTVQMHSLIWVFAGRTC